MNVFYIKFRSFDGLRKAEEMIKEWCKANGVARYKSISENVDFDCLVIENEELSSNDLSWFCARYERYGSSKEFCCSNFNVVKYSK